MRGTSWWLILITVIVGASVGVYGGSKLAFVQKSGVSIGEYIGPPFGGERYVRILMIGEDNIGRGLSDTLVVMAIDTQTREVRAISIPRDTMVEFDGITHKINSANAEGGPEKAKEVIQDLLGVSINGYIATTTKGLRGMVEMVGGVYIVVEKDMKYTDHKQKLYINLKGSAEKQLLNGEQAEGYVRFRHDSDGDTGFRVIDGKIVSVGRIVRQQKFMRALANRILSKGSKEERLSILLKAREKGYMEDNLELKDWKGLMEILKDFKPETMNMAVLPGETKTINGASYVIPDTEKVSLIVAQNLLFETAPVSDAASAPIEELPTIEVLNGSRIRGAARKVSDKLKELGFEVERTSNAPKHTYVDSCIITRAGKTAIIDKIAQSINCVDIREEPMESGKPDVTIIVGNNFSAML
ncbi:MAG: LCP family protein [Armatimonadetes bacterium]|nr:LCP family protein [Armatimonadota bacterium]